MATMPLSRGSDNGKRDGDSKDTAVELREEHHKDVVYSMTSKKDGSLPRNGSPLKPFSDDDDMREKHISRNLKGATLDFMVARLTEVFVGESEDVNFLNVFLTTFRGFASPEEVFQKLKDEYMKLKNESSTKNIAVLKSIVRVFRVWLERYLSDDFYDGGDHQLLRELQNLSQVHDDVMNMNEGLLIEKKSNDEKPDDGPRSPSMQRRNGVVSPASFADYVSAKLAVLVKRAKDAEEESPQHSPSHNQNPSLDLHSAEAATLNETSSKAFLQTLSSRHVATQLTVIAAKLFQRVQPHHCLAAVASSSKNRSQTVRATIDQFNRVVYCVVGTTLCPTLKPAQRTKLLTKWIEVAQECRELKNFSTLHAIVSGLQTHSLHRLKKAWMYVPASHTNLLKELADMDMKDLLMKVGTAKVNTEDSAIHRVRKEATMRRVQDIHSGIMHGTVPYLGSFLTDLTYLDSARPNYLEGGLINFEKRRKEFELLAQLQLWQASCRSYQSLEPDEDFLTWLRSVDVLTEDQSFKLSEMIEPPTPFVMSPSRIASPIKSMMDMIHSEAEKNMSSSPLFQKSTKKLENGSCAKENKSSQSFSGRINTAFSPSPNDKNRIVKIRLARCKEKPPDGDVTDTKTDEVSDDKPVATCEYKTITISSDERRTAVVRRALGSFMLDVEENLKRFSLVQLLQDKEIQIPDTANVFYAMNWPDDVPTLVLLEEGAETPSKAKQHQSTPNRPKKSRHRKNNSATLEPETGRASPLSNVTSPMKSLYKQLAFGSVGLVSGYSYSPSDASRRSSGAEEGIARDESVVLVNTKSGADLESDDDTSRKNSLLSGDAVGPTPVGYRRPSRSHSADFAAGMVLPVQVVRTSAAFRSTSEGTGSFESMPSSPESEKRGARDREGSLQIRRSSDVTLAAERMIDSPRRTESRTFHRKNVERSQTWTSRRALQKPKKRPQSIFYVNNFSALPSPAEEQDVAPTRSEFYVDVETSLPETRSVPRLTTLGNRSFSSHTLPSRFVPDFSGHDYEDDSLSHGSKTSSNLDEQDQGSARSASMGSTQWQEVTSNSDSGSGISFCVDTNEGSIFLGDVKSENLATGLNSAVCSDTSGPPGHGSAVENPNKSLGKELDESEFFGSYSETVSCEEFKNAEDHSTAL